MIKLSGDETQFLWNKQLAVLAFRKPKWILSSMFGPLVIIAVQILMVIPWREKLVITFFADAIAYGVYATFAIGIYIYLSISLQQKKSKVNPYLIVWLYGAYDVASLTLSSILLLGTGFVALETTGFPKDILQIGKIIFLLSYAILIPIIIVFTPYSIKRQINADKSTISPELRLAMAIPTFLVGMGVIIGQFFSKTGQFKVGGMLVGCIFLIMSFVLMSISISGIYRFIAMALQGFNNHDARQ